MSGPAPFTLAPRVFAKPWGGEQLEPLLGLEASGNAVGEAWLLADLDATSPSGAGGDAVVSVIESGWRAGSSLRALLDDEADAILGRRAHRFPLLLKLLEAKRHLSVQVHPSPTYARRHPGAHVKSEAWYALRGEADACFMVGVEGNPSMAALESLARSGAIGAAMRRSPIVPGDAVWLPSGLVHALGASSLVFEVQSASDTTYRLYDWSRETGLAPRELHIEAALQAADLEARPLWSRAAERGAEALVFETPAFSLHACARGQRRLGEIVSPSGPALLVPTSAGAILATTAGTLTLPPYRVTVVPIALLREATLAVPSDAVVLVVGVR